MTRLTEQHLTPDELDRLLASGQQATDGVIGPDLGEIRIHLAECDDCRTLVSRQAAVARQLMLLRDNSQDERSPGCPREEEWPLLAAGLRPGRDGAGLAEHAAQCDYCGALFREATEDFADNGNPDEDAMIARLQTSQRRGRRDLAARLSTLSQGDRNRQTSYRWASVSIWPRFAMGLAALALLVFVGLRIFAPRLSAEATADHLIAQAYTEERSFDLRLPGAAYAPVRAERGSESSRINRPAALLDAEALVARNLAAHPSDPQWLAAKGRIDLLEWNSDSAIKSLKQAQELQPDSAQFKSDLASAYFQRAEVTGQSIDYGTAAEWYGRALAQEPDNPIALFNRAITYEHLFLYDQALHDWQHYLKVDPKGEWATEAQIRMDRLQQKMKDRHAFAQPLPADPVSALSVLKLPPNQSHSGSARDARAGDEEYLRIALTAWLPSAFNNSHPARSDTSTRNALVELGKLLRARHGDAWLNDLLSVPPSTAANQGVQELAAAIVANGNGNTEEAEKSATASASHFRAGGNAAGELRARFEFLYALKRAQRGHACLDAAQQLLTQLGNRPYAWIRIQGHLEQSNCLYMTGQLQPAVVGTNAAMREAQTAEYKTLYLRALGLAASWQTAEGNSSAAWHLDCVGLAEYWAGQYDSLRAWQFYDDMGYAPRESSQWYLAVALGREAVSAVAAAGRPAEEAQARSRLATVAASAGLATEAQSEFENAKRLYHQLPRSATVRAFEANGEIAQAEIEYEAGHYSAAAARLYALHPELPYLQSYTFPLRYYVTLGKLHIKSGDMNRAEADLHAAVLITELGLHSLPDPSNRLTWERETGEAYRLLTRLLLLDRKKAVDALRVWEWYRSSTMRRDTAPRVTEPNMVSRPEEIPFGSLDSNPELPRMDRFDKSRSRLQNVTVVSYAWLNDGLAIWVFDNRSIHSQWIAVSQTSVERIARRFTENCADASTSTADIHRDGAQLYSWLLQPVAGLLPRDRTLVIQPDGPIAMIPFQALWTGSSEYLGAQWAIVVAPDMNFADKPVRSKSDTTQDGALIVGVPNVTGELAHGLPALQDAGLETEMVADHFHQRTVLRGNEATRDAVLRYLPRARVFHFAGHALSGTPHRGLLLTGAGTSDRARNAVLLDADTIEHIPMSQCWLAVLSACSTAQTEDAIVDPADLASAFLRSGVANVVASRWSVDSAVTRVFMTDFYSHLQGPDTVARALQSAAAEIRSDALTSHPHYWAAFDSFSRI